MKVRNQPQETDAVVSHLVIVDVNISLSVRAVQLIAQPFCSVIHKSR